MKREPSWRVFLVFLRLGLTSFGGPVAHLGYFREEFVARRKWLEERSYADLVALCQFLPGPASSQVGLGIGLIKAGLPGAVAAWVGFTLPSAVAMALFGYGVITWEGALDVGFLHGLKVVAVAVVAQAVWGMARTLCPDAKRASLAVVGAMVVLAQPTALGQIAVIAAGGIIGALFLCTKTDHQHAAFGAPVGKGVAVTALVAFFALLFGLPLLAAVTQSHAVAVIDSLFRAGSLVFGGGHVVLPLLQSEVVPPGWISNDLFLAGYGTAQAIPGPLFTFVSYLGMVMGPEPNGVHGALICLLAIFAPSFLLVVGTLPFWDALRRFAIMQRALLGINAAVVGLLLAALYHPVWTGAIRAPADFALALAAFALLGFWKVPPWLVVILTALGGVAVARL